MERAKWINVLISPSMHIFSLVKKYFHGNSVGRNAVTARLWDDLHGWYHQMMTLDVPQHTVRQYLPSNQNVQVSWPSTFISGWCWHYTGRTVFFDCMQTIWWHVFFSDLSVQLLKLKPSLISSHIPVVPSWWVSHIKWQLESSVRA